jgi:receptor expression-enhancing protein 5/6
MESEKDLVSMIQTKMNSFLEASPLHDVCKTGAAVAGVDKVVVFETMIAAALLLLVLIFGAELVVDIVCFAYPLASSVSAVERGARPARAQWITYWVTFFSFQTLESMMPNVLSSIPFYHWFKLAFMVWCYHPVTKGSSVVYSLMGPIREEILSFVDPLLAGILPAASPAAPTAAAETEKKATSSDVQYVPSGITVHLESLELKKQAAKPDDTEESEEADTAKVLNDVPVC